MIEQQGNLWDFHNKGEWIVITTNGTVKRNGEAVMGRGCALECKRRYPEFPELLGKSLLKEPVSQAFLYDGTIRETDSNCVKCWQEYKIITFPVKHNWWEIADLELIKRSLMQLNILSSWLGRPVIYSPRFGSGNGKRSWETEIYPLCEKYLDDKFIVLTKE